LDVAVSVASGLFLAVIGPMGVRSAAPSAHRARNAPQNQDKKGIKRADLALCGEHWPS
jgi:hypothetical protein